MNDTTLDTDESRISYGIGYSTGLQIKSNTPPYVQLESVIQGLRDGLAQTTQPLSATELQSAASRLQAQGEAARRELAVANSRTSSEFLQRQSKRAGVEELRSGVLYEVLKEGSGSKPHAASTVSIHFKTWLPDGRPLDSSSPGNPITVGVGKVLAGWRHALLEMGSGSKWRIYIPSELAHGATGSGVIPPHCALVCEIELIDVID